MERFFRSGEPASSGPVKNHLQRRRVDSESAAALDDAVALALSDAAEQDGGAVRFNIADASDALADDFRVCLLLEYFVWA